MQIHELNNFGGALGASSYVAVDNGNDTGKVSVSKLLENIESELNTLDTDLNARIDNIIAGGAAPSEAEIIDARQGIDNITYPSLGDAIRGQATNLQNAVLAITGNEEFVSWIDNNLYRLSDATATIQSSVYYKTQVIPCTEGDVFTISGGSYGGVALLWGFVESDYDVLVAEVANVTVVNKHIVAPANAAYLLVNFYKDPDNTVNVYKGIPLVDVVSSINNDVNGLNHEMNLIDSAFKEVDTILSLTPTTGKFLAYANGGAANGTEVASTYSAYAKITVSSGEKYYITTKLTGERGVCFYDANNACIGGFNSAMIGIASLVDYPVTIPIDCVTLGISTADSTVLSVKTKKFVNVNDLAKAIGYNKYTFTDGKAIITPGSGTVDYTPVDVGSVSCCLINCEIGDVFTINGTPRANSGTRPYMFVGTDDKVIYRSELTTELVDCVVMAPADGKLVVNLLLNQPHSVQKGYNDISKKLADYYKFKAEPLTNLPDYFVNNLAYKPIGSLEKGYVCLSCDDGANELATYTIPMLRNKGVPCTFSLWSTSPVFTDYAATVVDAIQDYDCELSQHGNQIWAEEDGAIAFTEERLRKFFDDEQVFWDSLGLVPRSAVCPAHYNNALVRAVAGGRFGSVRSGVDYVTNHYDYYSSGARSNLYGMSAQNINGRGLASWKDAIDYAYDNHKILNIYWHDWDLSTSQKEVLEAVIDYAIAKGIEFTTLGEIPYIL